jgi:hypothetical protein
MSGVIIGLTVVNGFGLGLIQNNRRIKVVASQGALCVIDDARVCGLIKQVKR